MCEKKSPKKVLHSGVVVENRPINSLFYRLTVKLSVSSAEAFAEAVPGQFLQLKVSDIALPPMEGIPQKLKDSAQRNVILRRPFSFSDIRTVDDTVEVDILYCVLGPATLRMTTLKAKDTVDIIGPLGNGFTLFEEKEYIVLVAGGMGAPPLQHLAKYISINYPKMQTIALAGARTAEGLAFFSIEADKICDEPSFSIKEFAENNIKSLIATDDGSIGAKGLITDSLVNWLGQNASVLPKTMIYSCGPEKMLEKVAQIAERFNVDCQVSLERVMGCGIGLCQSCAVKCKDDSSELSSYKLCCKDGPVFDSKEVIW